MKREYWCNKCFEYCPRRRSTSTKNGITTLAEIITHKDGTKERKEWAKFEKETERIISLELI